MDMIPRTIKVPRGVREIEIYFGGCLHFGHVGCNEQSIKDMVDHVAAKENRYLCLLGDVIDAIPIGDPRFNPRECAPWVDTTDLADLVPQQCRRAAAVLKRIPRERILAFLEGNHPRKTRTMNYIDSHRLLGDMLDINCHGEGAFLRIHFVGRDAGVAEPVTFYLEHGSGGAGSPEAVLTKLKKQAVKHPGADAYVGSHHHKAGFTTLTSAGIAPTEELKLTHKETPILTAGCHLSYYEQGTETYGLNFHMPVANIGPAKLVIYPWGRPGAKKNEQRIAYRFPYWA